MNVFHSATPAERAVFLVETALGTIERRERKQAAHPDCAARNFTRERQRLTETLVAIEHGQGVDRIVPDPDADDLDLLGALLEQFKLN